MEIQSRDFHKAVHQAFRDIAANSPKPNVLIDATKSKEDVELDIRNAVISVLPKR
jgi:thymidylate kinase